MTLGLALTWDNGATTFAHATLALRTEGKGNLTGNWRTNVGRANVNRPAVIVPGLLLAVYDQPDSVVNGR